MNLVIDSGNSTLKLAVFSNTKLIEKIQIQSNDYYYELDKFIKAYPQINRAIYSSVSKIRFSEILKEYTFLKVICLNHTTSLPFVNHYETPETLGADRIALLSAAAKLYPNKNVLIIDAGTCITYDILQFSNIYCGGSISPGIQMRYQSLHHFTAKLPLLKANHMNYSIGYNTATSIHSGIINGIVNEVSGFISDYKKIYSDLKVILTGGDAKFLSDQLKNSIFANPNLLLEGLNHILDHNSK